MLIYNRDYQEAKVEGIKISNYKTEQQLAMACLVKLSEFKIPVIVLTFNGSASLLGDSTGYDMPFIIKRSELKVNVQT